MQVFRHLCKLAWTGFARRLWLLGSLVLLFLALTLGVGPVAQGIFSQGLDFSGITLAVAAPAGDETAALVEQLAGSMRDVREFATLVHMEEAQALEALEAGEVTAVLLLPENFLYGVLDGTNPDVTLVVDAQRPLEALLTCLVGQSAADLLSAAQQGIYTVLELYPEGTAPETWEQVKTRVNLEFINLALNRSGMFRNRELVPTGTIPTGIHYGLSLLVFLVMTLPTLLAPGFGGSQLGLRRRLWVLGYGPAVQYGSCLLVCSLVILALILIPAMVLTPFHVAGCLLLALWGGVWASVCWGLTGSAAGCGWLSLGAGAAAAFLSGGILPPALMPQGAAWVGGLLPVEALRELMYLPVAEWSLLQLGLVALWILGMAGAGAALYRRKLAGKEAGL